MRKPVILYTMNNEKWIPQVSPKAPELDNFITSLTGIDRKKSIKSKTCATCGSAVKLLSFKDALSLKEFHISGMCQPCQDSVFGE